MNELEVPPTREQMAVAVAKDVLARLAADALTLEHDVYLTAKAWGEAAIPALGLNRTGRSDGTAPADADLRPHVDALEKSCRACLLGACLLSRIRLFNEVRLGEVLDNGRLRCDQVAVYGALDDVFAAKTRGLMETAFEGDPGFSWRAGASTEEAERAVDFGHRAKQSVPAGSYRYERGLAAAVRAVMRNVVANNGTFDPTQDPLPEEQA